MKDKKKLVLIVSVVVIVIIIFSIIILFKDSKEKPILICNEEIEISDGIKQTQHYEIIKYSSYTKVKQVNKLILNDNVYTALQLKGYNSAFINQLYMNSMNKLFDTKFKEVMDFIRYSFDNTEKSYSIEVEFLINEESQKNFEEIFKIDLYKSDFELIKAYYESGDMICEIN